VKFCTFVSLALSKNRFELRVDKFFTFNKTLLKSLCNWDTEITLSLLCNAFATEQKRKLKKDMTHDIAIKVQRSYELNCQASWEVIIGWVRNIPVKEEYMKENMPYMWMMIVYLTIICRRRGKYLPIFTEPEANNCFSIILRCGHQRVKKGLKLDKQHTKKVT